MGHFGQCSDAGLEGQRCRESWHQPWPERQMSCQEVVRVRGGAMINTLVSLSCSHDDNDSNIDDGKRDSSLALGTLSSHSRQKEGHAPAFLSACNACIGQEVSIFIGFKVSPLFHISYLYLLVWLWCIGQWGNRLRSIPFLMSGYLNFNFLKVWVRHFSIQISIMDAQI